MFLVPKLNYFKKFNFSIYTILQLQKIYNGNEFKQLKIIHMLHFFNSTYEIRKQVYMFIPELGALLVIKFCDFNRSK